MRFIDIHCHILPGVDDGAKNIEESIVMAAMAAQDGIEIVVATPHVIKGIFDNKKEEILKEVEALNKKINENGIGLKVFPGAEYRLEPNLSQRLSDGELLTLNDNGLYLLIELPSNLIPSYAENILYEIQLQGIIPIIAHPERNAVIARRPEILYSFVQRGMLAQITSTSIVGSFGKKAQKTAWRILSNGAGHVLGSDGHSPTVRAPLLSEANRLVESRYGKGHADLLVHENAAQILSGKLIRASQKPEKQNSWRVPWGL